MDIDVSSDPRAMAADDAQPAHPENMILQHRALCGLGLPTQVGKGSWQRDIGTAAVSIEAPATSPTLPGGAQLRLLLLRIFDTALRGGSAVVEIGDSPAALAERMGLPAKGAAPRTLGEQFERLMAAKVTVSLDGGPALSVFDARGRPRAVAPEWRSAVRLNARFFAVLAENPVALDRAVVAALADAPLALDAYMWMARIIAGGEAAGPSRASWAELIGRFGEPEQAEETFRAAFEDCLRLVTAACPSIVVIVGEQGVQVRMAEPAPARAPAERPAPPVAVEPVAETPVAAAPVVVAPAVVAPVPQERPVPAPPPAEPARLEPAQAAEPPRQIARQSISLKSHMTGLSQVVWLQRANGRVNQVIEVTPGGRYDPDHLTVLALEPMVVQISGGLYDREFERVSAWAMNNRDLIDDFWDGKIDSFEEVASRVKKVPAPGWR